MKALREIDGGVDQSTDMGEFKQLEFVLYITCPYAYMAFYEIARLVMCMKAILLWMVVLF